MCSAVLEPAQEETKPPEKNSSESAEPEQEAENDVQDAIVSPPPAEDTPAQEASPFTNFSLDSDPLRVQ